MAVNSAIAEQSPSVETNTSWREKISEARHRIADIEANGTSDADGAKGSGARLSTKGVLHELTAWRTRKARASQVPEQVILSERSLRLIAEHRPVTTGQLAEVTGMRASKLQRFGDEILLVLAECQQ